MNILAIEATELLGSVAAAVDDRLLRELHLEASKRSAQSLAPGLKQVLETAGWRPADVQLVAVTTGPGSFTGLRVGIATAKVFAYAAGAEIVGVDTLEVIAAAAPAEIDTLGAVIDAQRGDVVARTFRRGSQGRFEPVGTAELVPIAAWMAAQRPGTVVSGPVLRKWNGPVPEGVTILDAAYWQPTAANVARVAYWHYMAGQRDDIWSLLPTYSRRPAAEEKWLASQARQE